MRKNHYAVVLTVFAVFLFTSIVSCGKKTGNMAQTEVFNGTDIHYNNDTKVIIPGQDIISDTKPTDNGEKDATGPDSITPPDIIPSDPGTLNDTGHDTSTKDNGIKDIVKDTGHHTDTGCTHPGVYPAPTDPKDCSHTMKCGCNHPTCPAGFPCGYSGYCESQDCTCTGCNTGTVCNKTTGKCETDPKKCSTHTYCKQKFNANYYCGPNWMCVEKKPCKTDADCYRRPEGQKCNQTTGECYNCKIDSDCGWDELCDSGTCTKKTVDCNGVDYDNLGTPDDVEKTGFVLRMIDPKAKFFAKAFPDCKSNPNGIQTRFRAMNQASFISGGAGYFSAHFTKISTKPKTLYIGIKGELGFWRLPLSGSNTQSNIVLVLKQKFKKTPFTFNMIARESDGKWGALSNITVKILEAGGGPLQVSVLWSTATDVDLHLEEPGGKIIYYGCDGINWNPKPNQPVCRTKSGGTLDIDSNAACTIDGIDNENIFYAGTPPTGKYIIRVDYWSACDEDVTDFIVTLWKNGHLTAWPGTFTSSDADGGGAKSGKHINTFTWP